MHLVGKKKTHHHLLSHHETSKSKRLQNLPTSLLAAEDILKLREEVNGLTVKSASHEARAFCWLLRGQRVSQKRKNGKGGPSSDTFVSFFWRLIGGSVGVFKLISLLLRHP